MINWFLSPVAVAVRESLKNKPKDWEYTNYTIRHKKTQIEIWVSNSLLYVCNPFCRIYYRGEQGQYQPQFGVFERHLVYWSYKWWKWHHEDDIPWFCFVRKYQRRKENQCALANRIYGMDKL